MRVGKAAPGPAGRNLKGWPQEGAKAAKKPEQAEGC